ncbi:MAG: mercuric transporter MerT family protein [Pseudomonadota bacterium]
MIKWLAAGGATAALAATTCCVLPLALGSLGLGSALVSNLGVLAPYQAAFRLTALVLLSAGFGMAYARQPVASEGAACPPTSSAGWARPVLWAGALVLAIVMSEPVWGRWLA